MALKNNLKVRKKIIKKVLKVANIILTVAMAANTFMYDKKSMFAFVLTCISIAYIIIQIISEIVKFVRRKKKQKIKEEKTKLKKEFVANIKTAISDDKSSNNVEQTAALATVVDETQAEDKTKKSNSITSVVKKTNNVVDYVGKKSKKK